MTRLVESGDPDEMEERLRAIVVVGPTALPPGGIELVPHDDRWPVWFEQLAARIRDALGSKLVQLEHVGSTAVPRLRAKPVIDIAMTVPDSTKEDAYVPQLDAIGFVLRGREPDWYEHRLLWHEDPPSNLHIFSAGCPEIARYLLFRDRLRSVPEEREAYEREKQALARRPWRYMQEYADAKSDIVEAIIARARPSG